MLFHIGIFPLGGGQLRIQILQLLGGNKMDIPAQSDPKLGITDVQPVVGVADGPYNGLYNELQIVQIPVFPGNDLFPVPLVHINGVDVVQLLIPANGVHIRIQAVSDGKVVPFQGQPLPLGQGVDHLGILLNGGNIKADRPLVAVQVVVQSGILRDEQRRRDPLQVQGAGKLLLKGLFDIGNGPLGVIGIQGGGVVLRDHNGAHSFRRFLSNFALCIGEKAVR